MSRRSVFTINFYTVCNPWLNDWDTITSDANNNKKKKKKKKKKNPRARFSSLSRLQIHTHTHTHTQTQTTLVKTPLDEWSVRRRELYLTTHNTHNRQTTMPSAGIEPAIPLNEHPQTHALDCAATRISNYLHKTENDFQSGCLNNKRGLPDSVSYSIRSKKDVEKADPIL